MSENLLWILIGLVILVVLIWIMRSRSANRIDTVQPDIAVERTETPRAVPPAAAPEPMPTPAPKAEPVSPAPKPAEAAPVAAETPPSPTVAEPAVEPAAPVMPAPAAPIGQDNLLQMKGVGPKLAALLGSLGVTSFAQIAAWDEAEIDRVDAQLGTFKGRIRRDKWVEQAGYLARGDKAGFEAVFGKLDR